MSPMLLANLVKYHIKIQTKRRKQQPLLTLPVLLPLRALPNILAMVVLQMLIRFFSHYEQRLNQQELMQPISMLHLLLTLPPILTMCGCCLLKINPSKKSKETEVTKVTQVTEVTDAVTLGEWTVTMYAHASIGKQLTNTCFVMDSLQVYDSA